MAHRTLCDAMAGRMLTHPRVLALARPLVTPTAARFSSSEAAAMAEDHHPVQPSPQQQQTTPPAFPPRQPFLSDDPWSPSTKTPHVRRPLMQNLYSRPAPIDPGISTARGSIASNPYQQPSQRSPAYQPFKIGGSGVTDLHKFTSLGLTSDSYLGQLLSGMDAPLETRPIEPPPVLLKPVSGKTIHCTPSMDPARAFAALNRLTALEKTAITTRRQRFHERPGLKKKRLKSERWRARFVTGFSATVKRVQSLANMGW